MQSGLMNEGRHGHGHHGHGGHAHAGPGHGQGNTARPQGAAGERQEAAGVTGACIYDCERCAEPECVKKGEHGHGKRHGGHHRHGGHGRHHHGHRSPEGAGEAAAVAGSEAAVSASATKAACNGACRQCEESICVKTGKAKKVKAVGITAPGTAAVSPV